MARYRVQFWMYLDASSQEEAIAIAQETVSAVDVNDKNSDVMTMAQLVQEGY